MTSFPIQLRQITDPDNLVDMRYIGEAYYDTVGDRLCICNGPDVIPYPSIDLSLSKMVVPQGFTLSGYANNYMRATWGDHQTWKVYDSISGITIARISVADQSARLALDAVYNRTGPQSVECFSANRVEPFYTMVTSSQKITYRGGGNLWAEQNKKNIDIAGTAVSLCTYSDDTHIRGVRNSGVVGYAPQLYQRGRVAIVKPAMTSPYLTGISIKSKMYYPNAAKQDWTFYMTYACRYLPTRFATRIGWEGNWQTFFTNVTDSDLQNGCLGFHFFAKHVKPENIGKPINIEWMYDLIVGYQPGTPVTRGIGLADFMVLPGTIKADSVNPSFAELGVDSNHLAMYGTDIRTKYMTGRDYDYVNFPIPLLTNDYKVDINASLYPVEISQKTRFGFTCRSLQAQVNSRWKFTYTARL